MTNEFIRHQECSSCGSSDANALFRRPNGTAYTYCYSCEKVDNPTNEYIDRERMKKDVTNNIHNIYENAYSIDYSTERGLEKEYLDYFGVKANKHSILFPYYIQGELSGIKFRDRDQKKFSFIKEGDVEPFGWSQALQSNGFVLFITEGEYDAVALFQAIRKNFSTGEYKDRRPSVISVPSGAVGAVKSLLPFKDAINNFKKIVIVFDNDEAGKKATEQLLRTFPKAESVNLEYKDPNDFVIRGFSKRLATTVLFHSCKPKNTRIINASSLFEEAKTPAEWGLSYPWKSLTDLTRGIRFGETIYIGAGVKMGKSELVNALGAHLMIEHGLPIFMAKPEEANNKTVKMIAGKVVGSVFHDPKIEFDVVSYDKACKQIGDKLHLLNLYQNITWDVLRQDIVYSHSLGCKVVFIDPITNLVNGITAGETDTILQGIAQELAAMMKDLDMVAFIFCHLKAPLSGDTHERGGKVISAQFSGSRAMMRSCNYLIGLEGNKDPDLALEERNNRRLVLLEDREFGESGIIHLWWNKETSLFQEVL